MLMSTILFGCSSKEDENEIEWACPMTMMVDGELYQHELFPTNKIVCTHTLYNEVWAGNLDLSALEDVGGHETQAA